MPNIIGRGGAIIRDEKDERIFCDTQIADKPGYSSDILIGFSDHFREAHILFVRAVWGVGIQVIGNRVGQRHGIKSEKRSIPISPDKILKELNIDIGPVTVFKAGSQFPILPDVGLPVAGAFMPAE